MGAVVWSARANGDLAAIRLYLSGSSTRVAERFVRRLLDRADQLGDHPWLGTVVPEYEIVLIRELKAHPYRIIYEVFPDRVDILTVVHAARQLERY